MREQWTGAPFFLFFLYCTEQNTKVISLGEEEAFSKYDSTMFLKQPSSNNNRFTPETCVKLKFSVQHIDKYHTHSKIIN